MSTEWKSQVAKGDYRIQFETDDYEKYKIVEKACCAMIDLANEKDVASKKIEAYIEKTREDYFDAMNNKLGDDEIAYRQGVVRGLLDALYSVGGTSEK